MAAVLEVLKVANVESKLFRYNEYPCFALFLTQFINRH